MKSSFKYFDAVDFESERNVWKEFRIENTLLRGAGYCRRRSLELMLIMGIVTGSVTLLLQSCSL
jgi:hypothetical protein